MAEVNAVDLMKKNVSVDAAEVDASAQNSSSEENKAAEQKPEEKNIFAQQEEAKTVTSPVQKSSEPASSADKPKKDIPIEFGKIEKSDSAYPELQLSASKSTNATQEENVEDENNAFIERCLQEMTDASEEEKEEMRKKLQAFLEKNQNMKTLYQREFSAAKFIADNKINISDKALKEILGAYYETYGMNLTSNDLLKLRMPDTKTVGDGLFTRTLSYDSLKKLNTDAAKNNLQPAKDMEELTSDFLVQKVQQNIQANRTTIEAHKAQKKLLQDVKENPSICMPDIDTNKLKKDIKDFQTAMLHATTDEERERIAEAGFRYLDEHLDKKLLESRMQQICQDNDFSIDEIRNCGAGYSGQRTFSRKFLLSLFSGDDENSKKARNAIMKKAPQDIKDSHRTLNEVVFKHHTPKNEEEAREMAEATEEFIHLQAADLTEMVKAGGFDADIVEQVTQACEHLVKNARKYTEQFLEAFFETEIGQTVKKQTQYAVQEVREAKLEFEESKENTEEATEEAQEAKKQSEKAKQEALEEQKKAESIAANLGLKDLDFKSLYKVVKQESPRQANNLLYAKAKQKQAYWAEYDANVAKHHAEFLEGIAKKHFEFAQMKVAAAFAKMQAMMSVIH